MNYNPNMSGLKNIKKEGTIAQADKKVDQALASPPPPKKPKKGRPPGKYKKKTFDDEDLEEYMFKMAKKHNNDAKVATVLLKYREYKKKYNTLSPGEVNTELNMEAFKQHATKTHQSDQPQE